MQKDFYKNLSSIESIKDIINSSSYKEMPDDWYIIVTDVKNSTIAINEGKYKEVNMVGALSIISILNIDKTLDLPFVFGGDGAFILIPKTILNQSKQALLAVKKISKESYFLDLRVGIIPVSKIYENKKSLLITKLKLNEDSFQAIIKGGGLEYADELLKNSEEFFIKEKLLESTNVDLEGLECRWEAIKSPKDDTLAIIIKAADDNYYSNILDNIEKIVGDKNKRSPLNDSNLKLSFNNNDLKVEASIYEKNSLKRYINVMGLKLINIIGLFLMKGNIGKWGSYRKRTISSIDAEKFDDVLRMVVSTTKEQTLKLQTYLEKEFEKNTLVYGLHKSNAALMTCLIFERHGKHAHFVDSSNGGYAIAAKAFKQRVLKDKSDN
ncbi:DUF3095 domain-containing protein [Arcobacter sp. YIC-464]|uniref:DUF3095 domain-containing protein n=1 Tax=Arcobacter sp. YIC-464 TaxID=3376631 RepID=UPI003C1FB688